MTFQDLMKNIEKEAKIRAKESKNVNIDDTPNCINCMYVGRDGLRTDICVRCGMNTRIKYTPPSSKPKVVIKD